MLDTLQQLYQQEYNNFGIYNGAVNPLTTYTPNNSGLISNIVNAPTSPSSISSGQLNTQGSLVGGYLQSSNFKTGITGWQINSNGDVEFGSGNFRGNISSSTINIPNSTSPLFSVDSSGNVVASSLLRKDFHWFTVFESVSGYYVSNGGTGTTVAQDGGLEITSGVADGDLTTVRKSLSSGVTWDKSRKIKTVASFGSNINQTIYITTGSVSSVTNRHFGFRIINGAMYGTCADGTTQNFVNLSTSITAGTFYTLEAEYNVTNSEIRFSVNGTYKNHLLSNLPTGTTSSDFLFYTTFRQDLGSDGAKTLQLGYYDFWQSN